MSSLRIRLSAAILAVLVVALLALSFETARQAQSILQPEIERKAATVADSTAGLLRRALDLGIPIDRLEGFDAYLQRLADENADLSYVSLRDAAGARVYGSRIPAGVTPDGTREVTVAIAPAGAAPLTLAVGLDPAYARQVVSTLWVDLAIIMFVTAIVALELVYVGFGARLYGAIDGVESRLRSLRRGDMRQHAPVDLDNEFGRLAQSIDGRLDHLHVAYASLRRRVAERGDQLSQQALDLLRGRFGLGERVDGGSARVAAVRAPLFVFMLAEELTRPFLPVYIKTLATPVPGVSQDLLASLPMVAFLVIVAATQPILGGLTERMGRRQSLMIGALFGLAGYVASAFAGDLIGLTMARAVSGVGFALVFVAAQGFVIDSTDMSQRSGGMAMFIGAILVAGLCGPPIGGILADRVGIPGTFVIAGLFAALSLALAYIAMPAAAAKKQGPAIRWRDFGTIVSSPLLSALFFLCAMPAKIILVAFCFFLVPLEMQALGASQSATGRMLMIYPIIMVLLVPRFAALADRWNMRAPFVAVGGLVAGASAFVMLGETGEATLVAVMLLGLGLGQAISIAPLSGLVGELGRELPGVSESSVYGIFRLVERTGNALGPLIAGALLGIYGFSGAVMIIGGAMALCALAFAAIIGIMREGRRESTAGVS